MGTLELAIWCMALGAIGALALARATDLVLRPSSSQGRGAAYHLAVLLLVLILSGVLQELVRPAPGLLRAAQVLAGPTCVAMSNLWIRRWLAAPQRDRTMAQGLRATAILLPLGAFACLALPPGHQLPLAGLLALLGGTVTLWMTVRAALMGDRLAPLMAAGCLLTLPAIAILHGCAMGLEAVGAGVQGLGAASAALSNGLTGYVLWRREQQEWAAREPQPARLRDPVTRTHSGAALVRRMLHAQRRRHRTRSDGAVLAILLFDLERLSLQVGPVGTHELYITIAARIQRQVGVVNPVGRYWERCFVAMVETIQSPASLRTLGLRVATSLQRPIELTGIDGQPVRLQVDIGVGVVHLSMPAAPVEDVLDEAQRVAEAARGMPSRAAILDPDTDRAVPVETAGLERRRLRPGARLRP